MPLPATGFYCGGIFAETAGELQQKLCELNKPNESAL